MASSGSDAFRSKLGVAPVLRSILGIALGVLVVAIAAALWVFLVVAAKPAVYGALVLLAVTMGAGFFLGGAAARRVAGHAKRKGWMGAACALTALLALALAPGYGRVWTTPAAPNAVIPPVPGATQVHDFTVLAWLFLLVVGVSMAALGDLWAVRMMRPKPRVPRATTEQS